jgi:hypothetical protein
LGKTIGKKSFNTDKKARRVNPAGLFYFFLIPKAFALPASDSESNTEKYWESQVYIYVDNRQDICMNWDNSLVLNCFQHFFSFFVEQFFSLASMRTAML